MLAEEISTVASQVAGSGSFTSQIPTCRLCPPVNWTLTLRVPELKAGYVPLEED